MVRLALVTPDQDHDLLVIPGVIHGHVPALIRREAEVAVEADMAAVVQDLHGDAVIGTLNIQKSK